jgi:hypothetical protein
MAAKRKIKEHARERSALSPTAVKKSASDAPAREERPPVPARIRPVTPPATVHETVKPPVARSPLAFHRDIPVMYNETYLRAMPREEARLFSFWEVAPPAVLSRDKSRPGLPKQPATTLLRIYEVEHKAGGRTGRVLINTVPLRTGITSQYVDVPAGKKTYQVELGMQSRSGSYVMVCRSGEITMPSARVHDRGETPEFRADTAVLTELSLENAPVPGDTTAPEPPSTMPSRTSVTSPVSPWSGAKSQ